MWYLLNICIGITVIVLQSLEVRNAYEGLKKVCFSVCYYEQVNIDECVLKLFSCFPVIYKSSRSSQMDNPLGKS